MARTRPGTTALGAVLAGAVVVASVLAVFSSTTGTAGAATEGTTDRSTVLLVAPEGSAVAVVVRGGDDRLEVTVPEGHELEVPGYQGEAWLRIEADGTVLENTRAPTSAVNASRDGRSPLPADASVDGDARWEEVGTGGRWAWHDHRIHDMGAMAGLGAGVLTRWEVPMVLDGNPVTVTGQLERLDRPSPMAMVALGLAVAGATWLALRPRAVRAAAIPLAAAGLLTGLVATLAVVGELEGLGSSPSVLTVIAALLGFDAVGVTVVATRRRHRRYGTAPVTGPGDTGALGRPDAPDRPDAGPPGRTAGTGSGSTPDPSLDPFRAGRLLLAAAGTVTVGLALQVASWTQPVLITALPSAVDRALLTIAAGLVAGATGAIVASGLGAADQPTPGPAS